MKNKCVSFLRSKKLIILILLLACSGCDSEKVGLRELKRLCEKDAGLTINKTVEADGYYDDTTLCHHCWHGLLNSPFKYIEFCDLESERHPLTNAIKEQGCYRLTKVSRDSGQCHVEIDEDIAKRVIEPFVSFKKEQCIRAESIEKPTEGLGLFLNKDEGMVIERDFSISRYEYGIKSLDSNYEYGKFINYSLVIKTVGGAQHVCDSSLLTGERVTVKNPSLYKAFIKKVIVLNKEILL
ncbi:MAG: hypothetical protein H6995_04435 [Pseudomonadales bacterium]|nr:hypothetical protein [Pseudomonadales bacterium]